MIVGFDAKRFFHNFTGLGNYSRTLITNLCKYYPKNTYRLYTPKLNDHPEINSIISLKQVETITPKGSKFLWRSRGMVNQFDQDLDIYHGLSHELPISIDQLNIKSVVTIHDLIYHYYPMDFPWIDRKIYDFKFRSACRKADHIIAISENTKKDLVKIFNIAEEKISVIYQPVHPIFNSTPHTEKILSVREKYNLPNTYALYVGALTYRKNLMTVLRAYSSIDSSDFPNLVIVASGDKLFKEVENFITKNKLGQKVHLLGQLDFSELPVFYHQALFTIYPSLYEGFGLPVVESLSMGTPVITSNRSALPEAAGPGALLVNPDDYCELANKMLDMFNSPSLRESLRQAGSEYVQKFDERLLTQQMIDLYAKILRLDLYI